MRQPVSNQRQAPVSAQPRSGLTLLEVMIALAILGTSLAALGELIRIGADAADRATELTEAQFICDSVLAEIKSGVRQLVPITEEPYTISAPGMAASMGAMLLASGNQGRRFAWPHARIMIHQPLIMGTITGTATDLDIRARETIRYREELNRLLAHHTGQDVEKIALDTDRDYFMSSEEAKEYGLIDDIITTTSPEVNGKE